MSQNVKINEFMSSNHSVCQDEDGDYTDWIELYNASNAPVNLQGFSLSDEEDENQKWTFPSVVLNVNSFLIVFCSGKNRINSTEFHANFQINSIGEHLLLSNSVGAVIDHLNPISLDENMSYGRDGNGIGSKGFLSSPTPNASNVGAYLLSEITFSNPAGFYGNDFYLTVNCTDSVYYTMNGSTPTQNSQLYTNPILVSANSENNISLIPTTHLTFNTEMWPNNEFGFQVPSSSINKAAVLKFQAYRNGLPTGKPYSNTYFTNETEYKFPVLSLITDSLNLFDKDTGIYIPGIHLDTVSPSWSGNYYEVGKPWERKGTIEYFNSKGEPKFSETIGFRITGQGSRGAPQKSLRLFFRDEYGKSKIEYPFFESRDYTEYKRLVLRSTFTYWWGRNTLFQDSFIQKIIANSDMSLDIKLSRPSILFINGEYWGIHNIRENQDKHYFSSIYGINKDSIDIIGGNLNNEGGFATDFIELIDFVEHNDLSITSNYEQLKNEIDIENYQDYFCVETYFGNMDWPGNNFKIWRERKGNAKWKFMVYDLDAAFGEVDKDPFEHIDSTTNIQATLFINLMKNEEFKKSFVKRYLTHLKTTFKPDKSIELLDQMESYYSNEVSEHMDRWNNPSDYTTWQTDCEYLRKYITNRPCYMKDYLNKRFDSDDLNEFDCNYFNFEGLDNEFEIAPNPTNGYASIIIKNESFIPGSLTVYNAFGQIMYTKNVVDRVLGIDLSFLVDGVYIAVLTSGNMSASKKIVVLK